MFSALLRSLRGSDQESHPAFQLHTTVVSVLDEGDQRQTMTAEGVKGAQVGMDCSIGVALAGAS